MARHDPSPRELRWFGAGMLVFFGILGSMIGWRTDAWRVSQALWATGAALAVLYYAAPPVRRPLVRGWHALTFPIGWTLTHLVLATVFFLVITPAGLLMRLLGRDPMRRRRDPDAATYWDARPPAPPPERYFRQF